MVPQGFRAIVAAHCQISGCNYEPLLSGDFTQTTPRAVLDLAAQKAGWGKPLPEGRGRGKNASSAKHD